MAQIISVPFQGPGIPECHQEALAAVEKTSFVAGDFTQFIDAIKKDDFPELIVMDFGWLGCFPGVWKELGGI